MANPSQKSPEMVKFLDRYSGRTRAIGTDVCIDPTFGCGAKATDFRDEVSRKEYTISGLCQSCQDLVFGE